MSKRLAQGRSASSLFLIELILSIGFFAVASAVCLQLFVRATLVSADSADLSRATLAAQSAAESFRATDGALESAAALLDARLDGDTLTVWYDDAWGPCGEADAGYRMTLALSPAARRPLACDIVVTRLEDASELFRLGVKTPGGG